MFYKTSGEKCLPALLTSGKCSNSLKRVLKVLLSSTEAVGRNL